MPSSVTTTVEKRGIRTESAADLTMLSPIERILGTATNPSSISPPIHIEAAELWKKSRRIGTTWLVAAACVIRLDVTSTASPRISIAYISALLTIVLLLVSCHCDRHQYRGLKHSCQPDVAKLCSDCFRYTGIN